jgi:hypothetical protein
MPLDEPGYFKVVTFPANIGPWFKKKLLILRTVGIMACQTSPVRQRSMLGLSGKAVFFVADKTKVVSLPFQQVLVRR